MPLCKVFGCNYKTSHITEEHMCSNCGCKGHGKVECGNYLAINYLRDFQNYDTLSTIKKYINDNDDINDINDIKIIESRLKDGEYTSIYSCLGSKIYIRKVYKGICNYLLMTQDDWGQYDIETGISRKLKYDNFISGYIEIIL
jgi:hypothetical protein